MAGVVQDFLEASDWPSVFRLLESRQTELFGDEAGEELQALKQRLGRNFLGMQIFNLYLPLLQTAAAEGVAALVNRLRIRGIVPKLMAGDIEPAAQVVDIESARPLWLANPTFVTMLLAGRCVFGEPFWLLLLASARRVGAPGEPLPAGSLKPTLVIDHEGVARRIMKILPLSDGGLAVTAPYHQARSGALFKTPGQLPTGTSALHVSDLIPFSANDRVKLSYHVDGFTQFSGENNAAITSGRDPKTGEPKGLGLVAPPLDDPVISGPSIGCSIWGAQDFEEFHPKAKDVAIRFDEDEYYSEPQDEGETINGFSFSIFLVPTDILKQAIGDFQTGARIDIRLPMNIYHRGRDFRARLISLDGPATALIIAQRNAFSFRSPSGFELSGPSDGERGLAAIYPAPAAEEGATSLDRPFQV